jgi:glyoxylase-like metal-dependent hydrolase (beta-lactamase superfamily II)
MREGDGVKVSIEIFQTEVGLISNFNELISDGETSETAVVDPAFEVDRLLATARERGWKITTVLLTHTHHDHIDGVDEMVKATGATVYVGAGEVDRAQAAAPSARVIGLVGGERIPLGASVVEALATPGHTVAGISYLVGGAVMTGDTLFVGFCGRTDFPGGDPHVLWRSLRKLAALPEETRMYPGHDYGKTPTSTIGWECATNPYLLCKTEEEFVALRTGRGAPRPGK